MSENNVQSLTGIFFLLFTIYFINKSKKESFTYISYFLHNKKYIIFQNLLLVIKLVQIRKLHQFIFLKMYYIYYIG